jgi:predicted N-acetyltransferase YhbS
MLRALREARPEEVRPRDVLAHSAWGERLEVAAFCDREAALRATEFAKEGQRTWVLAAAGEVLASCETFRMQSRVGGSYGVTFGVASVFVEERLRGQGHASFMLAELTRRLRAEGAQACILYSEVGEHLYERVGFAGRPATTRAWTAHSSALRTGVAGAEVAALLGEADARPLPFRIRVTPAQIDWHFARTEFYRAHWGRQNPRTPALRAGRAWAILCPDHRNDRLALLDLEPGSEAETGAVIEGARAEAARLGLDEVTLEENPYNASSLPEGVRRPCDEGVPMIASFAPSLTASHWMDYTRAVWV